MAPPSSPCSLFPALGGICRLESREGKRPRPCGSWGPPRRREPLPSAPPEARAELGPCKQSACLPCAPLPLRLFSAFSLVLQAFIKCLLCAVPCTCEIPAEAVVRAPWTAEELGWAGHSFHGVPAPGQGKGAGAGATGADGLRPPVDLRLSILCPHSCSPGGLGIAAICIPPGCSRGPRVGTAALGHSGPPWDRAGHPEPAGRQGVEGSTLGRGAGRAWLGLTHPKLRGGCR